MGRTTGDWAREEKHPLSGWISRLRNGVGVYKGRQISG
jgi:hypothetical protein